MKAELETLKTTQQAVSKATDELTRLQELRAKQSETAAAINAHIATDMDALRKARQDVLTAIALGEAENSALVEVDQAIADAETKTAAGRRTAADAEQAAAGLSQRIEAAQAALQEARSKVEPARLACLEAYAEQLGSEYLAKFGEFISVYAKLYILNQFLRNAGGTGTMSPYGASGIRIPWFKYPSRKYNALIGERRAFVFDSLDLRDTETEKWFEAMREFLKKAGVLD